MLQKSNKQTNKVTPNQTVERDTIKINKTKPFLGWNTRNENCVYATSLNEHRMRDMNDAKYTDSRERVHAIPNV